MEYAQRIEIINHIFDAVGGTQPQDGTDIWSDGEKILSRSEDTITVIADLFDRIANNAVSCTGYYNPDEDRRDGCMDDHTGYYYVTLS